MKKSRQSERTEYSRWTEQWTTFTTFLHLIFFTKFFPLQIFHLPLAHIRALSSNQLIFRVKTTCYIPICWGGHALFFFSSCSMYSYSCFLHFCWFDKAICPFLFPFCQEILNILSVRYPSHFKDTPHAPGIKRSNHPFSLISQCVQNSLWIQ